MFPSLSSAPGGRFSISIRRVILALVLLMSFSLARPAVGEYQASSAAAAQFSASALIAEVNALRAANGLAPYQVDSALMAAAQAHSEYQAANGTITHSGAGGSSPGDRARAAGYGGGAQISVSENIAGGGGMSAQAAVRMWQGDGLHLGTLLSGSYTDVGAGMATSGDSAYFTLLAGYVAGQAGSGQGEADDSSAPAEPPAPAAPAEAAVPAAPALVAATPAADGSITHEVGEGQALWSIAALYQVSMAEIVALNNLNQATILQPGDKLLILPPGSAPTSTLDSTLAVTQTLDAASARTQTPETPPPSATPRPTRTLRPTQAATEVALAGAADQPGAPAAGRAAAKTSESAQNDWLLWAIGGLAVLGAGLLVAGSLLQREDGAS